MLFVSQRLHEAAWLSVSNILQVLIASMLMIIRNSETFIVIANGALRQESYCMAVTRESIISYIFMLRLESR
jgi:hypothetical protein